MFCAIVAVTAAIKLDKQITTARGVNVSVASRTRLLDVPQDGAWFYVRFKQTPDFNDLLKEKIEVSSQSIITRRWMRLFLDGRQARHLVSEGASLERIASASKILTRDLGESERSLLMSKTSRDFATKFEVEVRDGFDSSAWDGRVKSRRLSPNVVEVELDGDEASIKAQVAELARQADVLSISESLPVVGFNRWASPFVQSHRLGNDPYHDEDDAPALHKYVNDKGLNGEGVTVVICDSGVDVNHTMFYDPEYPNFKASEHNPKHRKVVYYLPLSDIHDDEIKGHGSHCAGSIAGKAACSDCHESLYSGVAPNAKLAVIDHSSDTSLNKATTQDWLNTMDLVGSKVSSNSWGQPYGDDYVERAMYESLEYENPDKLWLFAAGNEGMEGVHSTCSPGTSKNALTVGNIGLLSMGKFEWETLTHVIHDEAGVMPDIDAKPILFQGFYEPLFTELQLTVCSDEGQENCLRVVDASEATNSLLNVLKSQKQNSINPVLICNYPESSPGQMEEVLPAGTRIFITRADRSQVPESVIIQPDIRIVEGDPGMAPTSSIGTTAIGIIKPEIVAPGTKIKSAMSWYVDGQDMRNHGGLWYATGTSMATPLTAGSTALVQQYFEEGYLCNGVKDAECKVTPDGNLMRAMIVNSADQLSGVERPYGPNPNTGHGRVNLENVLHFADSNFSLLISQGNEIKDGDNLVAKITVTDTKSDLRITMSYMDVAVSPDSLMPLAIDLDLVVVGPGKKVYLGNNNTWSVTEHFSTVERVLIPSERVEAGEYKIHVISRDLFKLGTRFSVVCTGNIDTSHGHTLDFKSSSECDFTCSGHGKCNSNHVCKCERGHLGPNCDARVADNSVLTAGEPIPLPLHANDALYFSFDLPKTDGEVYLSIQHNYLSLGKAILFMTTTNHEAEVPIEFDSVDHYETSLFKRVTGAKRISGMVFNTSPKQNIAVFNLTTSVGSSVAPTKPTNEGSKSMNYGAGVAGWVLFALLAVGVVVIGFLLWKQRSRESRSEFSQPLA